MKSKSIYWKYLLFKIKYIFLRDSFVCTRWIFIFESDQAQINSVGEEGAGNGLCSLLYLNPTGAIVKTVQY